MLKKNLPIAIVILGVLVLIASMVKMVNIGVTDTSQYEIISMFVGGCGIAFIGFYLAARWEPQQTSEDRTRRLSASLTGLIVSIIILIIFLGTSSCTTQGYGCKGNSKNMLRVKH